MLSMNRYNKIKMILKNSLFEFAVALILYITISTIAVMLLFTYIEYLFERDFVIVPRTHFEALVQASGADARETPLESAQYP